MARAPSSRSVERWEGLALLGRATVQGVVFDTPALLDSAEPPPAAGNVSLGSSPAPPGARRLRLTRGDASVQLELPIPTPEVMGAGSGVQRISPSIALLHAPFEPGGLEELRRSPPELVVLGNAAALWRDGEPFVRAVGAVRTNLGAGPLLWAPRVALPHRMPLLAYLGVDLVDTTEGLLRAMRGSFFDLGLGEIDPDAARAEGSCDCASCRLDPPGPLVDHTRAIYDRARREVRAALRGERLRELVESRLPAEPALAEHLRYADRQLAPLLEACAPVTGGSVRPYVLAEAHRRPEMARFRARLLERYRPPPSKGVLLIVPCSRTKPYRLSPSHRRLVRALEDLRGWERVHVASVSSPIGLVPRELEDLPPARHYDIPVTGDWREEERTAVIDGLRHLLRAGAYRAAFFHLDREEYEFLSVVGEGAIPIGWTAPDGRTGSPESLDRLRRELGAALADFPPVPGGPLAVVREELLELASVQFGRPGAGQLFAPPIRLQGRPWFQRITSNGTDLASVRSERGLFHLTIAGAIRMAASLPRIEIDSAVRLDGDLFVPGIASADATIRAGDDVGLFRSGELAAVGEALLPGPFMEALARGLAVEVRHRAHASTDTDKS